MIRDAVHVATHGGVEFFPLQQTAHDFPLIPEVIQYQAITLALSQQLNQFGSCVYFCEKAGRVPDNKV